ncbi:hypothetical protein [Hymenobacter antarcticus]|uniref:Uncharacterized protein n=1 Tax=Hymenobacter antarcticus TaxID=486270 RepID=A0ABP7PGB3_9BACT
MVSAVPFAGGCSGSHEPVRDRPRSTVAPSRGLVGLDVPGIIHLSIDQLIRRLGPRRPLPAGFIDPTQAPLLLHQQQIDSSGFFQYRGLAVVAAYNQRTRRVSGLLLLGADEGELMRRANLELGAPGYLVLPVFETQRPAQLMGLRVLAAQPLH